MNNVSAQTITRTVLLALALINQALTFAGLSPLDLADETIAQLFAAAFTIGASIWAWWKNNSFTKAAIEADKYQADIKGKD